MKKITAEQAANAPVAQRTEQGASTSEAEGSSPSRRTKKMGRPELPPELRTKPRTIWMTDAEWAKVQSAPKKWVNGLVQRAKVPQA